MLYCDFSIEPDFVGRNYKRADKYVEIIDLFAKLHKLVHNGEFKKFEV